MMNHVKRVIGLLNMMRNIKHNFLLTMLCFCFVQSIVVLAKEDPSSFYTNFIGTNFIDQQHRVFSTAQLKGKLVLVNFIFTQCSNVCPIQTKSLLNIKQQLPAELNQQVVFVSISLDPMHDTPTTLNRFAQSMHADTEGWLFLSSKADALQRFVDKLSIYGNKTQAASAKKPNDHMTNIWLLDKTGRVMQRYAGNPVDEQRIAKELAQLSLLK